MFTREIYSKRDMLTRRSSSGSRISAAGSLVIKKGRLSKLSPLSGHYRPPGMRNRVVSLASILRLHSIKFQSLRSLPRRRRSGYVPCFHLPLLCDARRPRSLRQGPTARQENDTETRSPPRQNPLT